MYGGGEEGRGFKIAEVVELISLSNFMCFELTSLSKQLRPRSDAAKRGVWSGSKLFATQPAL